VQSILPCHLYEDDTIFDVAHIQTTDRRVWWERAMLTLIYRRMCRRHHSCSPCFDNIKTKAQMQTYMILTHALKDITMSSGATSGKIAYVTFGACVDNTVVQAHASDRTCADGDTDKVSQAQTIKYKCI
jgi:hypothetical protein